MSTAVASCLLAASCQTSGAARAPRPGAPPVVAVTMREMAFDHGPVPRGRVVLEVRNAGRINHRLSVVPLAEDFPPLAEQLRGETRRFVDQLASTAEGVPRHRGVVAVDMAPGRYAFMCFVVDPDAVSHALKGMFSEFRVR